MTTTEKKLIEGIYEGKHVGDVATRIEGLYTEFQAEKTAEIAEIQRQKQELESRAEKLAGEKEILSRQRDQLQAELAETQTHLSSTRRELEEIGGELMSTRDALDTANHNLADTKQRLQKIEEEYQNLIGEHRELDRLKEEVEAKLKAKEYELKKLEAMAAMHLENIMLQTDQFAGKMAIQLRRVIAHLQSREETEDEPDTEPETEDKTEAEAEPKKESRSRERSPTEEEQDEEIVQLHNRLQELNREVESLRNQNSGLKAKIEAVEEDESACYEEVGSLNKNLKADEQKVNMLEENIKELTRHRDHFEAKMALAEKEVGRLESEVFSKEMEISALNKQNDNLLGKTQELEAELTAQTVTNSGLQRELDEKEGEIGSLQERINSLEATDVLREQQLAEKGEEIHSLQAKCDKLNDELQLAVEKRDELQLAVETLKKKKGGTDKVFAVDDREEEVADLLVQKNGKIQKLEQKILELQQELEVAREWIAELEVKKAEIESAATQKGTPAVSTNQELQEALKQANDAKRRMEIERDLALEAREQAEQAKEDAIQSSGEMIDTKWMALKPSDWRQCPKDVIYKLHEEVPTVWELFKQQAKKLSLDEIEKSEGLKWGKAITATLLIVYIAGFLANLWLGSWGLDLLPMISITTAACLGGFLGYVFLTDRMAQAMYMNYMTDRKILSFHFMIILVPLLACALFFGISWKAAANYDEGTRGLISKKVREDIEIMTKSVNEMVEMTSSGKKSSDGAHSDLRIQLEKCQELERLIRENEDTEKIGGIALSFVACRETIPLLKKYEGQFSNLSLSVIENPYKTGMLITVMPLFLFGFLMLWFFGYIYVVRKFNKEKPSVGENDPTRVRKFVDVDTEALFIDEPTRKENPND